MGFDKQFYEGHYGKEHRKPYRRLAQQIDKTCRCHGTCTYCVNNRLHFDRKNRLIADEKIKEVL